MYEFAIRIDLGWIIPYRRLSIYINVSRTKEVIISCVSSPFPPFSNLSSSDFPEPTNKILKSDPKPPSFG